MKATLKLISAGRLALPHVSGYCITKYGVQAFSDALRREMSPWGILVSIIEPGLFRTAMANEERNLQAVQELWDGLSPQVKEEYGERAVEKSKYGQKSITEKCPWQWDAARQFTVLKQ